MVDRLLFRPGKDGGNPDIVKASQEKRFAPVEVVDEIVALDETWRKKVAEIGDERGALNKVNKEIGGYRKKKEAVPEDLTKKQAELKTAIENLEKERDQIDSDLQAKLNTIGNIVADDVPVSKDEANNKVITTWGNATKWTKEDKKYEHDALLHMIGGYNMLAGNNVSGPRCYYLTGAGVRLSMALMNYALDFLESKGHNPIQPPYFMKPEMMGKTAQLSQFDEELYKVSGKHSQDTYLIATSEQPISCYYADTDMNPKQLPIKFAGFSTCFRQEAGSSGRDVAGIFRVHQFEKAEQFCITSPEESWNMFDAMISNAEEFYQSLGIPYQTVAIVSGELNNAAAKKIDLEGWFPGHRGGSYRELVSCSNCTDYQSRQLNIYFGQRQKGQARKYCHLLNSTLCANTRTICAILENHQSPEGIVVPEALRKYIGKDILKYVNPPPKASKKKQKK